MSSRYSEALDQLSDTLRWCLSRRGLDVIEARAAYLSANTFSPLDMREATHVIAGTLHDAEPVFWESRLCEIIESAAFTLPEQWRFTSPFMFTQNGYVCFSKPITLPIHDKHGGCNSGEQVVAMAWKKREKSIFVDLVFFVRPTARTLLRTFKPLLALPQIPEKLRRLVETLDIGIQTSSSALPDLSPKAERAASEIANLFDLYRRGGIPWVVVPWRLGETVEQVVNAMMISSDIDYDVCRDCNSAFIKLFGAALNFLNTKVFISRKQAPEKATIKRVADKPQWREVNVITLRRAERVMHEGEVEHREVDWAGHWLVGAKDGGFWRHQPMKNANGEWIKEWRFIAAYIKGPLDKPFMPPKKRAYEVTR